MVKLGISVSARIVQIWQCIVLVKSIEWGSPISQFFDCEIEENSQRKIGSVLYEPSCYDLFQIWIQTNAVICHSNERLFEYYLQHISHRPIPASHFLVPHRSNPDTIFVQSKACKFLIFPRGLGAPIQDAGVLVSLTP